MRQEEENDEIESNKQRRETEKVSSQSVEALQLITKHTCTCWESLWLSVKIAIHKSIQLQQQHSMSCHIYLIYTHCIYMYLF